MITCDEVGCPYNEDGICTMENPELECDDYYAMVGDEEE